MANTVTILSLFMYQLCPLLSLSPICHAVPANPRAFHVTQPDGKITTPQLYINGDERFSYISDRKGFTVIKDDEGWEVYAQRVQDTTAQDVRSYIISSGLRVGLIDPLDQSYGLEKHTLPDVLDPASKHTNLFGKHHGSKDYASLQTAFSSYQSSVATYASHSASVSSSMQHADHQNENGKHRHLQIPNINKMIAKGKVKNLVVLIRFADHTNRTLPMPNDFDVLMNRRGGHPTLAPTGSFRDVYFETSYNQLDIHSVIYNDWITLSHSEAYYANQDLGTTAPFNEAMAEAMDVIDRDDSFSLSEFDGDKDGVIDVITFFHSGYGAENGGNDCQTGRDANQRIWSHFRDKGTVWRSTNSSSNISLASAIVATGLWGTCSSELCRIGTVSHEFGHFLGLNDMYDGSPRGGGVGVGCFSLMGNIWGFDSSQLHPVSSLMLFVRFQRHSENHCLVYYTNHSRAVCFVRKQNPMLVHTYTMLSLRWTHGVRFNLDGCLQLSWIAVGTTPLRHRISPDKYTKFKGDILAENTC